MKSLEKSLVGLLVLLVVGCGEVIKTPKGDSQSQSNQESSTSSNSTSNNSTASSSATTYPSATLAEAEQFAAALTKSVEQNDEATFHRLVDWRAMADTATARLGVPASTARQLASGLVIGVTKPGVFVNALRADGEAQYTFMRAREVDGQTHAIFRLVGPDGVNYHDFTLAKVGGQVRAVDLYVFLSGESMADTWERLLLPVAKEQNKNWMEKLTSKQSEFVKNIDLFTKLSSQLRVRNFQGAMATYYSMPESMKKDKAILLMRYQAANGLGDDEIIKAAEAFRLAHPDAKCIELLMLDSYYLRKEYDQAIACVDKTLASLGPDAHLEMLAGNMLREKGDTQKAIERLKKATNTEPTVEDAFWILLTAATEAQDFPLTAETLTRIEKRFQVEWEDLGELPEYAGFVASPEGKKWMSERGL